MDREDGFTVVETLVGVALITIAMAVALVVFIQATGTSERYVETTSNQADLTNAITKITHSLSTSPTLTEATEYSVEFKDSTGETVRYMYFQPTNPAHKKYLTNFKTVAGETYNYGKKPRALPSSKGEEYLVEIRTINGKANFTVLATGVDMDQDNTGMPLFTYYDKSNAIMEPPVGKSELMRVTRVGVRVVSATSTRADTNAMELGTSISFTGSRFGTEVQPGNTMPNLVAPGKPVLQGILPRPTQKATLSWPLVAGADAYILYRDGNQIATLGESDTSYVDNNRPWGGDQTYHLVAAGPGGLSPESNSVLLRVVPERPAFTNVNPKAAGSGSTVARNLTNHLSWTPRSGAVGYKLFRGNELIYKGPNTSFADTGRNYGDVTSYTVIAYNDIVNNSGGDSLESAAVSLISPPVSPVLSMSHKDGIRNGSWNAPANATKYDFDRTSPSATGIYEGPNRSASDSSTTSAATFTYRLRAGNDAGWSPWTTASVQPRPGPVSLKGYDYDDGPRGDKRQGGQNELEWTKATNAIEYKLTGGAYGSDFRWTGTSGSNNRPYGSTTTYTVAGCNRTGCGPTSSITLLQGPSNFAVNKMTQTKRHGVADPLASAHPSRNWGSMSGANERLQMDWKASAGAEKYTVYRKGTSGSIKTINAPTRANINTTAITPGQVSSYKVRATAANGVYTETPWTDVHIAPAGVGSLVYTPYTTNGYNSQARYYSNGFSGVPAYTERVGSSAGTQYQLYTVRSRISDDYTNYSYNSGGNNRSTWGTWNGEVRSATYNKSDAAGNYMVGTVMFTRTYVNIANGSWGAMSFTSENVAWGGTPGSNSQQGSGPSNIPYVNRTSPKYSTVVFMKARTGLSNPWTGSYSGSSWKRVAVTADNYPSSHDHMNEIRST